MPSLRVEGWQERLRVVRRKTSQFSNRTQVEIKRVILVVLLDRTETLETTSSTLKNHLFYMRGQSLAQERGKPRSGTQPLSRGHIEYEKMIK